MIILCILISLSASGFDCNDTITKNAVEYSDFIADGKVISVKDEELMIDSVMFYSIKKDKTKPNINVLYFSVKKYKVLINATYKGYSKSDTIILYSGNITQDCKTIDLEINQRYIVYANSNSGTIGLPEGESIYWTYTCSRTRIFTTDEKDKIIETIKQTKAAHNAVYTP